MNHMITSRNSRISVHEPHQETRISSTMAFINSSRMHREIMFCSHPHGNSYTEDGTPTGLFQGSGSHALVLPQLSEPDFHTQCIQNLRASILGSGSRALVLPQLSEPDFHTQCIQNLRASILECKGLLHRLSSIVMHS
jgi:hypothetical protein